MADTYRPLTAEDPVGTEVYHVDDKDNDMARKIVHIDGDKTWTRWRGVDVVHPTARLRVRVPDPWGELLEAAKAIQGACYLDDNVLQRKGVTTIECDRRDARTSFAATSAGWADCPYGDPPAVVASVHGTAVSSVWGAAPVAGGVQGVGDGDEIRLAAGED